MRRKWTDEDAAYAAAQWASGVSQKDIAAIFGYANTVMVNVAINRFLMRYNADAAVYVERRGKYMIKEYGEARKALVKPAIAHFRASRNGTDKRWPSTWKLAA